MKAAKNNGTKSILAGLMLSFVALAALSQTVSPFNLPLYFEASRGQTEFFSRGNGYEFEISASGAQMALRESAKSAAVAQMQFIGANSQPEIHGDGELVGKINYLIGNDASKWQTGLPTFSKVQLSEIYPGINVVFHGNQRQLEYDFTIAPGANPNAIKIRFTGVDRISLTPDGRLILQIGTGQICQPKPGIYQTLATGRRIVSGGYKVLDARTVAFNIGDYDRSLPLVIDPLLSYSSYFGGLTSDIGWAITLDTNNNVYVAGQTLSKQFFTKNAFQTNFGGGTFTGDAFVAKFSDQLTNLIYLTYLGGSNDDAAYCVAVDQAGNAFVAGETDSPNFPTNNALFPKIPGKFNPGFNSYPGCGFVAELTDDGSQLIYSTYLGGSAQNAVNGIALDSSDNAYVAGLTYSTNFPVSTNALQKSLACTNDFFLNANAFVAEISSNDIATNLLYSTYLGGTNYDVAASVAVDANDYVYVA
ncbi:MAG TPA: SBBP repeat-containing protein, partial [Candidatus Acidoferrum sp.]|nr:SBBP repeat-containing protein [Candidatus Acidoferrum sp.]